MKDRRLTSTYQRIGAVLIQALMGVVVLGPSICQAFMAGDLRTSAETCCPQVPANPGDESESPALPLEAKTCPLHEIGKIRFVEPSSTAAKSIPTLVAFDSPVTRHTLLIRFGQGAIAHLRSHGPLKIPPCLLFCVFRI
jgi:hypothetical protein